MTQQNYITPSDFQRFLNSMQDIKAYAVNGQKPPFSLTTLRTLAKIEYGCGLRITEVLNLKKQNFDLENNILTLENTKTGWKKCNKCKGKGSIENPSKSELVKGIEGALLDCPKCNGEKRIRKIQFTTIPPWLVKDLRYFLKQNEDPLFPVTRFTIWKYYKQAGKLANLKIFEQQEERKIEGVWTHLLRKSCSKFMKYAGANRELRMLKLRHAYKDAHDAYDVEDINSLKKWESDNWKTLIPFEELK